MYVVLTSSLVLCWITASCMAQLFDPLHAHPENCRKFLSGSQEHPCPDGYAFSTLIYYCVPEESFLNNQCHVDLIPSVNRQFSANLPDYNSMCQLCMLVSQGRFPCTYPSPFDCSKFINCSKGIDDDVYDNLPSLADECEYPDLFNAAENRCQRYAGVRCGGRYEPKEPCEYSRNLCGRTAHCRPCWARFGSCKGKVDGLQGWSGREWSPYFTQCKNQRTLYSGECTQTRSGQPRIFSPMTQKCDDLALIPKVFGGLQ